MVSKVSRIAISKKEPIQNRKECAYSFGSSLLRLLHFNNNLTLFIGIAVFKKIKFFKG
jgi:hypothetical protein